MSFFLNFFNLKDEDKDMRRRGGVVPGRGGLCGYSYRGIPSPPDGWKRRNQAREGGGKVWFLGSLAHCWWGSAGRQGALLSNGSLLKCLCY